MCLHAGPGLSVCTATRAHLAMIPAANGGFSRRFVCAEICLRECAYACMHAHIKWSQLAAMVNRACFVRRRCSCYPGFMWVTFGPFLRHCVLKIAKDITYFISEVDLSKKVSSRLWTKPDLLSGGSGDQKGPQTTKICLWTERAAPFSKWP